MVKMKRRLSATTIAKKQPLNGEYMYSYLRSYRASSLLKRWVSCSVIRSATFITRRCISKLK